MVCYKETVINYQNWSLSYLPFLLFSFNFLISFYFCKMYSEDVNFLMNLNIRRERGITWEEEEASGRVEAEGVTMK